MKRASKRGPAQRATWAIVLLLFTGSALAEQPPGRLQIAPGTCEQLPVSAAPPGGDALPAQAEALPAAVNGVRRILDAATTDKVARTKQALAKQRPVLFSLEHPEAGKLVGDLWVASPDPPAPPAAPARTSCGNTIVVVGYDDARFGGAFEVLRDCGATSYAESALWMRYDDFKTLCQCAVELVATTAATNGTTVAADEAPPSTP